jgi:uncharacterized protein YydD (DUF2326 family)
MIEAVSSSLETFRQVSFQPGMNVILADRADDSVETDSTNGLGKTTLLRIIHFCLGAELGRGRALAHPMLKGTSFKLSLIYGDRAVDIVRNTADPKSVWVTSSFLEGTRFPVDETNNDSSKISLENYKELLTVRFIKSGQGGKYVPSFREISYYLIRVGKPAYTDPTTAFQGQSGASKRASVSYLLGLNWSSQQKLQGLLDARKQVDSATKALQEVEVSSGSRSIGELEAERVALEASIAVKRAEVESFNVREDYHDLQDRLSLVDRKLHDLINDNFSDKRLLQHYANSAKELPEADPDKPVSILRDAGAIFREDALRKLEEVAAFHAEVHKNRAEFLNGEISRLKTAIWRRERKIDELSDQKSSVLQILKTSGALETLIELQRAYTEQAAQYEALNARLAERKRFDLRYDELSADIAHERALMKRDLDDRQLTIDEARRLFAEYTKFLYGKPAGLGVNVNASGYTFTFTIDREGSDGVEQMAVFCFDLTIATLRARRKSGFQTLVHDSTLFADVDPRQYGLALQLAAMTSLAEGFQYICCLNSGALPTEHLGGLNLNELVRLRLTDKGESGRLLGVRLPPQERAA